MKAFCGEHGARRRALNGAVGGRRRKILFLALGLLLPAALLTCQSNENRPPNLLLISIDTLRPDRLSGNGYARPTSPTLDRLAANSLVFSRAYSQSGWTLPSMATIMTGLHPKDHQAVDFNYRLKSGIPTLATLLAAQGYDTRAYVSHTLLTAVYGFDQGFAHFDASVLDRGDPHAIETSQELTGLAIEDLKSVKQPFCVWVHYFDPHFAYLPHASWAEFGDTDSDRYDQEIAHTDAQIARLLDVLRGKKLLDRTFVIVTADHGEEFGEHGAQYHETCYEEVVRVPLMVSGPGIAPGKDDSIVQQIDLLPTMLALLGVAPPAGLPGANMLAPHSSGPSLSDRPLFIERNRPPGFRQRALLFSGMKLIRVEERDLSLVPPESRTEYSEAPNVHAGVFLYDLSNDPRETRDLAPANGERVERMLASMASHFSGVPALPPEQVTIDERMRERLRALGYIR